MSKESTRICYQRLAELLKAMATNPVSEYQIVKKGGLSLSDTSLIIYMLVILLHGTPAECDQLEQDSELLEDVLAALSRLSSYLSTCLKSSLEQEAENSRLSNAMI